MTNSSHADASTIISWTGAIVSISSVQPIVTLCASVVAIISGLFAIRYYYRASKRFK